MNIDIKTIQYLSDEHKSTIELRNKILREPIGLVYTEQDLEDEKESIHIGAFVNENLIGACFLTSHNDNTLKLRQMAVSEDYQKMKIGSKLISFAEEITLKRGYEYIYLHARKEAFDFYIKQNYKCEGNEFIEVGIPHFEMIKKLK